MVWCKTSVRGGGGGGIMLQPNQKRKKRVEKEIREKRDNKMGVETENMFIDKKSKEKGNKKNPYKKNVTKKKTTHYSFFLGFFLSR